MVKQDWILRKLISVTFLIFNMYYWYRYIFKYNSVHTSPTYSNTPISFQIGKYILSIILSVLLIISTLLGKEKKLPVRKAECAMIFLMIWIFIKSFLQGDMTLLAKMVVFIIPSYFVIYCNIDLLYKDLTRCTGLVLLYHLLYSFIQIILYCIYGRLPALAYNNALIRFGGGWDDPNAFAIFLIVPLSYCIFEQLRHGIKVKYACLFIVCLALEIITFSYAGYIAVAILCVVVFREFLSKKRFWLVFSIILCVAVFIISKNFSYIQQIANWKLESSITHVRNLFPQNENLFALLWGNSKYTASENFYNIILSNYGIFALIMYIVIEIYFVKCSYDNFKFFPNSTTFTIFIFLLCVSISQIGIPYMIVFPINYLFYLFSFVSVAKFNKQAYQGM